MKILVTGGTGYIGSHTVVELIGAGHEPVIADNLSNSKVSVLDGIYGITGKKVPFYNVDCTDLEAFGKIFEEHTDIKAIIHFAASKAVGESVKEPLKYYRNNLTGILNVLECMKRYGVNSLVFSSSCTVYGQPEKLPVTEDAPIQPALSPYGNTKQICEEIIRDTVSACSTLRAVMLRYFNPIGAHESALIGELPLGVPQNLIPYVTQTAAGIRECLTVFGDDYDTPDGSCIRDYINVTDLALAHIKAVERMESGAQKQNVEVFNIGTGKGTSVFEVIRTFEDVTGVKLNYKVGPRREGDIEKVWADASYANNELGWRAEKNLRETLASAWKWQTTL